ncbi:uncharacterized protein LOC143217628 [Lasioglossum baleicum]|uniref:uncharacterized protein LOC143217628 n=1 Tax=Lasioglossum baleicum TaxID=434251 RepID=UPI003FCCBAD7
MKCSKCNGALCNIENSLFCIDCLDKPKRFRQDKIKQAAKLFNEAINCIDRVNVKGALKKLEECLNIRRRTLYKSHEDIVSTLRVIPTLYMVQGRFADAIECRESLIAVAVERFGPSSVQHVAELWELVTLSLMYLRRMSDTTTSSYKALFATVHEHLEQIGELTDLNFGSWGDPYRLYKQLKDVANTP